MRFWLVLPVWRRTALRVEQLEVVRDPGQVWIGPPGGFVRAARAIQLTEQLRDRARARVCLGEIGEVLAGALERALG